MVARGSLHGDPGRQGAGKGRLWVRAELRPPPADTRGGAGPVERFPGFLPVCKAGGCRGDQGVQSTPRGAPPVTLASLLRLRR